MTIDAHINPTKESVIAAILKREKAGKKTTSIGIISEHEPDDEEDDDPDGGAAVGGAGPEAAGGGAAAGGAAARPARPPLAPKIRIILVELIKEGRIVMKAVPRGKHAQYSVVDLVHKAPAAPAPAAAAGTADAELSTEFHAAATLTSETNGDYFDWLGENCARLKKGAIARINHLRAQADGIGKDATGLEVAPVWLGFVTDEKPEKDYANFSRFVTSSEMYSIIKTHAKQWTRSEFEVHPLKKFFKQRAAGGYEPQFDFDVDHALPAAWGGWNHPRNFFVLPRSLNRSFKCIVDEKMSLVGPQIIRQVQSFARLMRTLTAPQAEYALKLLPRVGFK
jgi:hypothetical protein